MNMLSLIQIYKFLLTFVKSCESPVENQFEKKKYSTKWWSRWMIISFQNFLSKSITFIIISLLNTSTLIEWKTIDIWWQWILGHQTYVEKLFHNEYNFLLIWFRYLIFLKRVIWLMRFDIILIKSESINEINIQIFLLRNIVTWTSQKQNIDD